jgi:hypothetical protein
MPLAVLAAVEMISIDVRRSHLGPDVRNLAPGAPPRCAKLEALLRRVA